jgi:hypothetical protein
VRPNLVPVLGYFILIVLTSGIHYFLEPEICFWKGFEKQQYCILDRNDFCFSNMEEYA